MKTRLSNKQNWLKNISLTKDDKLYVGIDVHKKSYNLAFWLNDAPAIDFVMPADNAKVCQILSKLRVSLKTIVYEAGPTGYSLARALQCEKLPIQVIAPAIIPRISAKHAKTDRTDCRKLAKFAAKGLLRKITIPTEQQEADRQLTRQREQLVPKIRRVKIQIKSFLLQHGIQQPHGLVCWSNESIEVLRKISLSAQLRYCLDCLIKELDFLKGQLKELEKTLKNLFSQTEYDPKIKILQTHPGIGTVIARQYAAEIFNPKRFKDKTEIAKYVGLCPNIIQSGETLRDGPIVKTGRPQLRCNLVEAAWVWVSRDPMARNIYKRLLRNTGQSNKAITAMARKMAVNLWKMLCDNKPYIQPSC